MEEPPDLMPVHRIVGGVEVEHQFLGRAVERGDEGLDHRHMRRPRPGAIRRPIEAPHRRGAGEAPVTPTRRLQHQIVAQILMVVDVFVAQRHRVHPLTQQRQKLVPDLAGLARINEPTRKPRQQAEPAVRRRQQQRPAIRRDIAAAKIRHHPTPTTTWKFDLRRSTIRHRRLLAFGPI